MADALICPVCGETNPADMEFCRNCQSRLHPLPGSLKDENTPIQPGEPPTKKVTSELEPLLPQWLRDARQQARQSAAETGSEIEPESPAVAASSGPDLLAGLESQTSDDEEDVPEWLANITGATNRKKKPVPEDNQVKWVELGRREEKQRTASPPESTVPPSGQTSNTRNDDLADWFKQAAVSGETADFPAPATPPDLQPMTSAAQEGRPASEPQNLSQAQDLGWLRNLDAAAPIKPEEPIEETRPVREDVPDWLKKLQAEQTPPPASQLPEQPASLYPTDVPDWLKRFGGEPPAPVNPEPAAQEPAAPTEPLPGWLTAATLAAARPEHTEPESPAEPPITPVELPDWISSLGKEPEASLSPAGPGTPLPPFQPEEPAESAIVPGQLPDWLSSLREAQESSLPAAEPSSALPESQTPQADAIPGESATANELPDWVSSLSTDGHATDEPATAPLFQPSVPIFPSEPPPPDISTTAATSVDQDVPGDDVDAIFASMETPDWLSTIAPRQTPMEENVPAAAEHEQPIGPAELPSWVQAMRPVESAMVIAADAEKETPTEERGPLAGLHGVLPAIPGAAAASSKPKSHSIKLEATEQQLAHAALLEQILAAETSPIPMRSAAVLRSQRVLRWVLSLITIVVVAAVVYSGSQFFALPTAVPNETVGAIQVVESLPAGAPILLVFDYQPATVGEMEATGASLIDHLVVMKHPYFALLSTSPTGSALAERFMSTVLVDKGQPKYSRDAQYVNLGYLPGGLAGLYNFALNPRSAMPLDASSRQVWQSATLAPIQRLSDFAAIMVLTDSVESGRAWVEQTQLARGSSPLVLVSSAQAGSMLMPYLDSGQVDGMVSGIYGAAAVEQRNAGSPSIYSPASGLPQNVTFPGYVRRYWDAYNIGLYLAVALIVLGGLWNLWLGFQDRRAQAVG